MRGKKEEEKGGSEKREGGRGRERGRGERMREERENERMREERGERGERAKEKYTTQLTSSHEDKPIQADGNTDEPHLSFQSKLHDLQRVVKYH